MAPAIIKPNPYVIVEAKDIDGAEFYGEEIRPKEIVFKYPKSKVFVGGLDFKLT